MTVPQVKADKVRIPLYNATDFEAIRVTAVKGNSNNYWVIFAGHTVGTGKVAFKVFELSTTGLSAVPVTYEFAAPSAVNSYTQGHVKVSPDRTKIAYSLYSTNIRLNLLDFNATTGVISNNKILNTTENTYGVDFTHDSKYLYAIHESSGNSLNRYTINAGTQADIIASRQLVRSNAFGDLQLGPDKNIYLFGYESPGVFINPASANVADITYQTITGLSSNYLCVNYPVNLIINSIELSNSSITEGNRAGAVIGTLSASFEDGSTNGTFSLVAGDGDNDNALFTITNGELKANGIFDYETKSAYTVRIRATPASATETLEDVFTIAIKPSVPVAGYLNGLQFDGVNDYVEIPSQASNQFSSETETTVSMWYKANSMAEAGLFNRPSGGGDMQYWLAAANGKFTFGIDKHGYGWTWVGTTDAYKVGEWVHVAAVRRNVNGQRKMEIYANGVLVGSGTLYWSSSASSSPIRIGTLMNVDGGFANGQIDNVSLWKKALTVEEIKTLGANTLNGNETDLAGYWRFDETTGTIAYDATANVNHGTLKNMDLATARVTSTAGDFTTNEDVTYTGKLAGSDESGNALTYSIVTAPTNGTLTLTNTANGAFTYTPAANINGTDVFTYKVNNGASDSEIATVNVAIVAVNDAPVAVAKPLTADADANCQVVVEASAFNNNSSDIDGDILTFTVSPSGPYTAGVTNVTLTVSDGTGGSSTATTTITVADKINPTITAPIAVTVNTDAGKNTASGAVLGTATTADNCAVASTTNDAPATFPLGNTTVTWTVTDAAGNTATSMQVVTVTDNEKPVPTIATLPTITGECSAIAIAPTATDNAAGTVTGTTTDPLEYLEQGTYTITWTYNDGNGNTATQTQQVIVKDVTAPVFATVAPITKSNDADKCGAIVTYTAPTAADNCVGGEGKNVLLIWDEMNVNTTNLVNSLTDAGLNVTLSATNETGYNGTNPSLTGFDAVIHLNGTTYMSPMPIAGQNALVDFVVNKGKTYITNEWSAYEEGSMATMNDIIVLKRSNGIDGVFTYSMVASQAGHPILKGIPTSFALPMGAANVGGIRTYSSNQPIVLMTSEHGAAVAVREFSNGGKAVGFQHAGNYNDYTTLSDINAQKLYINSVKYSSDNVTITQTAGLSSGALFPIGATTNTFVATDAAGNTSEISFDVTVTDTQKPSVVTQNITVNLDATGNATITAAQINNGSTDNCSIPAIGYSLDKSTFTCDNVGPNTVTLTVTDANGNTSSATAIVTVKDVTAPLAKAKNITVQLDATGAATITPEMVDNSSSDICGTVTLALSKTSFDCSNIGANTVTLTATDSAGNESTATATVTIEDKVLPKAIAKNITVTLDASGNATIAVADVNNGSSDNCGIKTLTLSKTAFDCSNVGENSVTLTVTDKSGNAHEATAIVTIVDEILPVAIAKNITVQLDANGVATIAATDINNGSSDACGIKSMILSKTAFDCSNVGDNTITLTVTDNNGNVATATAIVNVEDKVLPIAKAQNVTIELDANGVATLTAAAVDNGSSDACGAVTLALSKATFDCSNVGANTVTLTVTDKNGNKATVDATVTVVDNIAPVAVAKNITVQLDATGNTTITVADVNDGSTDNCSIKTISLDKTTFDCSMVGESEVVLTVTDVNNNTHTATAIVTVEDKVAPVAITQNINVQLDAAGNATITADAVDNGSSDACGIKSLSLSKKAFDCSNIGDNTVTLTVTDNNGNVSTNTAIVTVQDKIAPIALTKNITVKLDAAGKATIVAEDVNNGSSDVCGSVTLAIDKDAFDCSNIGENTVTLTVTDADGNEASETATVTIVDDLAPIVVTQNLTVQLDATGKATITAAQI
ncbi:HYR domain-containing protein, partial [Pontibacter sp. BT310]